MPTVPYWPGQGYFQVKIRSPVISGKCPNLPSDMCPSILALRRVAKPMWKKQARRPFVTISTTIIRVASLLHMDLKEAVFRAEERNKLKLLLLSVIYATSWFLAHSK